MSISFNGNYLYSFTDSKTADSFRSTMDRRINKTTSWNSKNVGFYVGKTDSKDVIVLTGQDYKDYQKATEDIEAIGSCPNYVREQILKGYAEKAILVDCKNKNMVFRDYSI